MTAPTSTAFIGYQEAVLTGTPTAAGVYPLTIRVMDASGASAINDVTITITSPVSITSLSPASTASGGPGFTLTVNGAGFESGAAVNWNGAALPTTLVNANRLTATVGANRIASPGSASVTVTSGGATSAAATFNIVNRPAITSLSPASAAAGGPAFTLTVRGTGFASDAEVNWDGAALPTTYVSSDELTATVAAELIANQGTALITVSSGGATSTLATFTVVPGPDITSLSPPRTTAGGPAFQLTVFGSGFAAGAAVNWNDAALPTTFVSANRLIATVAANLIANRGVVSVTVSSGGGTSPSATFNVVAGPAVTSLDPPSATAGGPAFSLTINGTSFASGATVSWNETALQTTFVSANRLSATVGAELIASPVSANVTVTSDGVTAAPVTFNVVAGPVISSLNPASAVAGGPAFSLTVDGTGFASGATVRWNETALPTTFVSANQLTAMVAAGLIANQGTAAIAVTSGDVTSAAVTFSVVPGLVITSLNPSSTAAGGPAFSLAVRGAGFASGATLNWNGAALPTVFVSAEELTATVAASLIANRGTASVSVSSEGTSSPSVAFEITAEMAPTVTSLSPVGVAAGRRGFSLTVNGTGFEPSSVVQWNGAALATTYGSSKQLSAPVESGLIAGAGTASITVLDSRGSSSNAIGFRIVSIPEIVLTGLQPTAAPTEPLNVGIELAAPSAVAIDGTLALGFEPLPSGLPADYRDPTTQFAAGGTVLPFTIPAGATTIALAQNGVIQQGTVAGALSVSVTRLTGETIDVLPENPPTRSVAIAPIPPVIVANSVKITNLTNSGFTVELVAYSTLREISRGTFSFTAASGAQLDGTTAFTFDLADLLNQWYASAEGLSNGSAFRLQAPFTVSGDPSALQAVSVTLANSLGTSTPVIATK